MNFIAKASESIHAPIEQVWDALVNPEQIKKYMFGTTVVSDWKAGSPISWSGEWEGKSYRDRGVILRIEPPRVLEYSHFSPLTGEEDTAENYHRVTIELAPEGSGTRISLSQDKNASEKARANSEKNWRGMLSGLKKLLEATHDSAPSMSP
jgi:uncharacterized protein YndB with AHSA1/START domain